MTDICKDYVEAHITQYERELKNSLKFDGAIVVDTSFLNGFLRRRLVRDEVYFNLAEVWYAERMFNERFHGALGDNVSFPPSTRKEFANGAKRLEGKIEDPHEALIDRWGGRGGEPAIVEYKIEPVDTGNLDVAREQLVHFVSGLKYASHLHRVFPSEAFVKGGYDENLEKPNTIVAEHKKSYVNPNKVKYDGITARQIRHAGDHRGFREIKVRPLHSVKANHANRGNDHDTLELCKKIAERMPVQLFTSDGDFKRMIRRSNPNKNLGLTFDYEGVIETIR